MLVIQNISNDSDSNYYQYRTEYKRYIHAFRVVITINRYQIEYRIDTKSTSYSNP